MPHLETAPYPLISFGQGCEGEPLLMWETIRDAISSGIGLNVKRSWVDTIGSSSGCKEIQPTQFALQAGETGTGHSQRPREKFLAAGQ